MSKLDALIEGERRGLLNPEQTEILSEARRRGLAPSAKKTTGLGALGIGAAESLSFGFSDEALAGAGALYDVATGRDTFSDAYGRRVAEERELQEAARRENPAWYYTGAIGGGVAFPMSAPGRFGARVAQRVADRFVRRPGLGQQMARGAVEGAGYGALYGAGQSEGDLQARSEGAVGGAVGGGIFGGAAPLAIQGITSGARAAGRGIQNYLMPEAAATTSVGRAMAERLPPRNAREALAEEMIQRGEAGEEMLRLDASERARALARRAANLSPEARQTIGDVVHPRFEGQSSRMMGWMQMGRPRLTGDNQAVRAQLTDQARAANRPAYERSMREGDRPLNSPRIQEIINSPMGLAALRNAIPKVQNEQVLQGYSGLSRPVQMTDDGLIVFQRGNQAGPPSYPNLQLLDAVKREFDDVSGEAFRQGRNQQGSQASRLATELRTELDRLVPSYGATRSQAARFFGVQDAVEAGTNLARPGARYNWREARRVVAQMSDEEREVFQTAYENELLNRIENVPFRQDLARNLAKSPAERQKLRIGMGERRAREFEAFLHIENIMDRARGALGNSTTARQMMELTGTAGLIGGGAWLSSGDVSSFAFWMPLLARAGGQRLAAAQNERWARQVADLLTRQDNPQALRRAVSRLARNDRLVERLRNATTLLAPIQVGRVAGEYAAQEAPLRVTVTGDDVAQARGQ